MRNLAKYLVEVLQANGVEVVFGIPGVHSVELYRGLDGSGIRHITPRHEQGAGFMADGYARVTRKPGVCFVITGPGMTNIATAMGQAYGDSIPMLVISTVNSPGELGSGRGHLHEMKNQSALAAEVSAFSHRILTVQEVEPVLARAFALFAAARPRPVHIEIPVSTLQLDASDMPPAQAFRLPLPPAPTPQAVREAVSRLAAAKRPLIIAGGGAIPGAAVIRALALRLGAPVLMTVNARGIVPGDDPLAVPVTGDSPGVAPLIKEADVILALGTELGPTDFADKLPIRQETPGWLIRVDVDPEGLMRGILPDLPILADAAATAAAILDRLPQEPWRIDGWGPSRAAEVRDAAVRTLPTVLKAGLALLDEVMRAQPDAVLVGDSCQPVYAGCSVFGALQPSSWFCSATGFGTLGYALPAAIGAAIGAPSRTVIGLIGDGGIQFTLGELGSAVEAGTAVRMILWNNEGYAEIKRFMRENAIPPLGVDIYTPDFSTIAKSYGWAYEKASSIRALRLALKRPSAGNEIIEIDEAALLAAV